MVEDGSLIAVLEVGPYSALGVACCVELDRVGGGDGAAGDAGDKACTEEDGEDAEVLGGVVDDDLLVASTECVLEMRTEVVRENHGRRVTCHATHDVVQSDDDEQLVEGVAARAAHHPRLRPRPPRAKLCCSSPGRRVHQFQEGKHSP